MKLCEWQDVMKQSQNGMLLKDLNFSIEARQHLGIKFTQDERQIFYELLVERERPTSGQINRSFKSMASCRLDDGVYEGQTVKVAVTLFSRLTGYAGNLSELYEAFALSDLVNYRIKDLTSDQRHRLQLLRATLKQPDLLYLESPISLLSHDGVGLYLKALDYIKSLPLTLLITATSLEELVLLNIVTYHYQVHDGLELVDVSEEESDSEGKEADELTATELNRVFKVACKLSDKTVYFNPNEIDYIESINSVSTVQVNGDSYPTAMTLSDLEDKLKHFGFFRCHRSYLVNLQRINELVSYSKNSYTLILKKPKETLLPLSRSRLDSLRQLIEL